MRMKWLTHITGPKAYVNLSTVIYAKPKTEGGTQLHFSVGSGHHITVKESIDDIYGDILASAALDKELRK